MFVKPALLLVMAAMFGNVVDGKHLPLMSHDPFKLNDARPMLLSPILDPKPTCFKTTLVLALDRDNDEDLPALSNLADYHIANGPSGGRVIPRHEPVTVYGKSSSSNIAVFSLGLSCQD